MSGAGESILHALNEYRKVTDFLSFQKALRSFEHAVQNDPMAARTISIRCRVGILSNYSTQFIARGLKPALAIRGVWAEIYEAGYNHWESASLDYHDPLYAFRPDVVLLLLTSLDLAYAGEREPDAVANRIAHVAERIKERTHARVFLTLPEPLPDELSSASYAYGWRSRTIETLESLIKSIQIELFDLNPLIRSIGAGHWYSDQYYVTSKLPFHPKNTFAFVNFLAMRLSCESKSAVKLIIVDLDWTLWGGVVGDDGWENIDLDPRGSGIHFLRMQSFLKDLRSKGVLLAIVSKNSLEIAQEVFRKRSEMILKESDFICTKINWQRKSQNIQEILDELNLSTSGVVFIDDNAAERLEVTDSLPEIIVPDLPNDPEGRVPALLRSGLFDRVSVTEEGLKRQYFYEAERLRKQSLNKKKSFEEYLEDLKIRIYCAPIEKQQERVVELVQKTNQFNLTNRRMTWSQMESLLHQGGVGYCFRMEDRFGDYGFIAVVVLKKETSSTYLIELWVMSCRVMGRAVEKGIFAYIIRGLRESGVTEVIGEYIPSSKNGVVENLYVDLGFSLERNIGGHKRYRLSITPSYSVPMSQYAPVAFLEKK